MWIDGSKHLQHDGLLLELKDAVHLDNNLEKEGSLLYKKDQVREDPAQELIDEYKHLNSGQDLFEQNASD